MGFNSDYLKALVQESFPKLIQSLVIFFVGWWAINKICKIATIFFQKGISDRGIVSFLNSLMKFSLRIVLLIIVMATLGMDVTSLMAAVAASVVAVGIALKDNISNFVSGIILVISKPIHAGDTIEFDGLKGKVLRIEMMFTTLKSDAYNKLIIVPNSKLISNSIKRESDYNMIDMEIAYSSGLHCKKTKEIKLLLEKELILNNQIIPIPAPEIKFALNEEELKIVVKVWTQIRFRKKVEKDIRGAIKKVLSKYNPKLPNG